MTAEDCCIDAMIRAGPWCRRLQCEWCGRRWRASPPDVELRTFRPAADDREGVAE
jgi:hypothetical protein